MVRRWRLCGVTVLRWRLCLQSFFEQWRCALSYNESDLNPGMPVLYNSSEDEDHDSSWAAKKKYPPMRGGGLNDSDEPKFSSADADKTISDEMALELQKALARSRKNKTGTARSKLQYEKRKQSKLEYDEKIFCLSHPEATQKNKEKIELNILMTDFFKFNVILFLNRKKISFVVIDY
jgi:hypothetical protein